MMFCLKIICQHYKMNSKFIVSMFCLFMFSTMFGQNNNEQLIRTVFNKLVTTYGNAKPAPKFVIRNKKSQKPAEYIAQPTPTIFIDSYVYTICSEFKNNKLNALSIIISHELAHYYGDHTFCTDYAVATRKQNKTLAPKLIQVSLNSMIEKETEADQKGIFYAAAAGFTPFKIYQEFITKLYKAYALPDALKGYPSKQERITIANNAEKKATELYGYFKNGAYEMQLKNYDKAISAFEKANSFIPFRENYNNIGVAKALKALLLKPKTLEEAKFPNRFLYPIEIENKSRLSQDVTRTLDDASDKMEQLLKSAQKDFMEAIRLDPSFTKAHINLACIYDLQDNPMAAIGKIKELTTTQQKTKEAQRILAIAFYNADLETKAEVIWGELKM